MHFTLNISKGCFVAGMSQGQRRGAVYHESVVRPSGSITVTPRPPALGHCSGRRHKERRSFVKGFSRYIYSHHFTCFCHSTELALFILDGPCAPLDCNT